MLQQPLEIFSFKDKTRTLHLSWMAFFISFMVWFNHAPLMVYIRETFSLSDQEVNALLIINVALTIPARIVVGMLVDHYGPRIMFSLLMAISSVFCFMFAAADSYQMLTISRFLLGFVGAGFVIGIRLISEWFPAKQLGTAEGIYGGWGNFGSAASAMLLPGLALLIGGENGWRYAIATTGLLALVYSLVFYRLARNTPKGSTYFKPGKSGAMEVSSRADLVLYVIMNIPIYGALAILAWKLSPSGLAMLSQTVTYGIYLGLTTIFFIQVWKICQVNARVFNQQVPEYDRYSFSQVAALDLAYLVTFGCELALVSMLPLFYIDVFGVSALLAGVLAASYPVLNLIARPAGGIISDRYGRKLTLVTLFVGISLSFLLLGQVNDNWALPAVVIATLACGLFAQAGSGAVYAMVPQLKRRMTGQISGMVGAYGNIGGLLFLTAYSFTSPPIFFSIIAGTAILVLLSLVLLLKEPEGQIAEVLADGTVQMIDVG